MILPRLSAALLSMNYLGTAYTPSRLPSKNTVKEWALISGAANGAASVMGVDAADLRVHRRTAHEHLTRYAEENGLELDGFDLLFDLGSQEGGKIVLRRSDILASENSGLVKGFHHDKVISYPRLKLALDS